jgi:hypothetical protein
VAKLGAPADALIKPLLPDLYEPVLTNIGNGLLVLRGFERLDDSATVQKGRCKVFASGGAASMTADIDAKLPDRPSLEGYKVDVLSLDSVVHLFKRLRKVP